MKGIVIYKGKYGATKQYALWAGQALNLPVMTAENIHGSPLKQYDFLVIGTSVYIGKLQIRKWLKENLALLRGKKIFLFQVAGTPTHEKEKRQAYNRASIPEELLNDCTFFFLPGRMIMDKLSWMDRFMLKMGARLTKDPVEKSSMLSEYDEVNKDCLVGLLQEVNNYLPAGTTNAFKEDPVRQF